MITVCLPGILAWVLVRVRSGWVVKGGMLLGIALVFDAWFSFVMGARGAGVSVMASVFTGGVRSSASGAHAGLNMYEELCWLIKFNNDGSLLPNWGARYFAELVNIIPRAIWAEKPTIGLDYAVARGQVLRIDGSASATISTGMIGGGVNNFGIYLGPVAAGLIMSLWVTLLGSLDSRPKSRFDLPLFLIGLVLTFNLGRDITFLGLYPFFFGLLIVRLNGLWIRSSNVNRKNTSRIPMTRGFR